MSGFFKSTIILGLGIAPFVFGALGPSQNVAIPEEFVTGKVSDPISVLLTKIGSGAVKLAYESEQGYLRSILKELAISPTSQVLVFSKTSLQSAFISPDTPRAIYFNDQVYVGWIPGAPTIELIGMDPEVGPVFYTIDNGRQSTPSSLARKTHECFQCHMSPTVGQVPSLMARSVFTGRDGFPRLANGSFKTTSTSPISERWGGWYVTGKHGLQRHMGNEIARGDERASKIDTEKGANVTDLSRYFDVDRYVSPYSDIVALMVFEQQLTIHNLITKAGFSTRKALQYAVDAKKLNFPEEHIQKVMADRIQSACEPLVQALLGSDEPQLTDSIEGTSGFAKHFSDSSPADKAGRRLSQLDLKTRLLKHPCSPLIYSPEFNGLPKEAKAQIYKRLDAVLSGTDQTKPFSHLTNEDRKATLEILLETLPEMFAMQSVRFGIADKVDTN